MSRERMTVSSQIALLRRAFPLREPGSNFAYGAPRDRLGKWREVTWWVLMASASGRFSVHPVVFTKPDYNLADWINFMETRAPDIIEDKVVAALNRSTGDNWRVLRPICWVRGERSRAIYRTSQLAEKVERRRERAAEARQTGVAGK